MYTYTQHVYIYMQLISSIYNQPYNILCIYIYTPYSKFTICIYIYIHSSSYTICPLASLISSYSLCVYTCVAKQNGKQIGLQFVHIYIYIIKPLDDRSSHIEVYPIINPNLGWSILSLTALQPFLVYIGWVVDDFGQCFFFVPDQTVNDVSYEARLKLEPLMIPRLYKQVHLYT